MSAREVSSPSPDAPPVTMALRRLSDRPLAASSAVMRAPKADVMGDLMREGGAVGAVVWVMVHHDVEEREEMVSNAPTKDR